ncbi:MAG TPA: hypothetical protein VFI41_12610 [Gemmatimonadales bacterium]|nr:hypothetical protein [Gemmatimonadales bacterium]
MHINFSIDGEDVVSREQQKAFAAVLRAVADTLAAGAGSPVVEGFRAPEVTAPSEPTPSPALPGRVTPLVAAEDPYLEKPKKAKKEKAEKVPDSKDPAQTSFVDPAPAEVVAAAPLTASAAPTADELRAITNKYTNRFGLAKLRETVTAFGVKKLLDLTDAQKIEWATARNAELAAPAAEEN